MLQGQLRSRFAVAAQDSVGADTRDHKTGGQAGSDQHVAQAIGHGGIEDNLDPADRVSDAVPELKAGWGMHPRVQTDNPERRQRGTQRHGEGCKGVHPGRYAVNAEQHDAEERGFHKKSGQYFVAQQWPGNIADPFHEPGPVGAKLKGHGDAADHAQRKGQRKNFHPEAVHPHPQVSLVCTLCQYRSGAKVNQEPGESHADSRKQNVETDVQGELDAGQIQGVHISAPCRVCG